MTVVCPAKALSIRSGVFMSSPGMFSLLSFSRAINAAGNLTVLAG